MIMTAAIFAAMSGAPDIARENRRRLMKLAQEHGQSPKRLIRLATDCVAAEIGGGQ